MADSPFHSDPVLSDRLKVAIVSSQDGFNGGERQMALLAEGLRARGHEICVLARANGAPAKRLSESGLRVETFHGRGRSPASLYRMRKTLSQFRPNVLHYNDSHSLISAGVAAIGLPIPLRIASRRVDFQIRSTRHYHFMADRVLCVSNAVKVACQTAGIHADCLRVVHDGVDSKPLLNADPNLVRAELGLSENQKVLVSIASLTDCKGHRYLLEALAKIVKRRQDVVLLCAGDGDLSQTLRDKAIELGISDYVRFLGFRNDTPNLIAAADMMVVASHTEGLCSSIIDAMMIGCPVVSTDAGGIPDLMHVHDRLNQPTGWMVKRRDAEALSQAILVAFDAADERKTRQERARDYALQNFTQDCMVENTISVYRERSAIALPRTA